VCCIHRLYPQPTTARHGAIAIFLIAASYPASYKLEEFARNLGPTVRSDLTAALLQGVTLARTGVGDVLGKAPQCTRQPIRP
jgi:hypothetical protein